MPELAELIGGSLTLLLRELLEGRSASAVHLAYHFAAIRQIQQSISGPRAED